MIAPKLYIKSRKAPSPEGFVEHASLLDTMQNEPFYAIWKSGNIQNVFIRKDESISLTNFKKGIISLFQVKEIECTNKYYLFSYA